MAQKAKLKHLFAVRHGEYAITELDYDSVRLRELGISIRDAHCSTEPLLILTSARLRASHMADDIRPFQTASKLEQRGEELWTGDWDESRRYGITKLIDRRARKYSSIAVVGYNEVPLELVRYYAARNQVDFSGEMPQAGTGFHFDLERKIITPI